MIHHIKGEIIEKNPTHIVAQANGIGYLINISLHTFSQISDKITALFYTHPIIKEDSHLLYGFSSKMEREVFGLLISISGIGPSIAISMLSSMSPEEIADAISSENVAAMESIKGIGSKTAQRIILDLKDKIFKVVSDKKEKGISNNSNKNQAIAALEVLGYARKQTEKILNGIIREDPSQSVESLIKRSLKSM